MTTKTAAKITTWGYECVAMFDGKPGGRVTPTRGSLWASKDEAKRACKAGSARITRHRAVVGADGGLD